jgi:signal peptidase II
MLILCLSFAVALLDQYTKHLVTEKISLGNYIPIIPGFFDLRYIQNTGAAWGILTGLNHWLVAFSLVMMALIVRFRHHLIGPCVLSRVAMGLIVGGITGNLIDRVHLSYVVDFLHFYWGRYQFPAFNVADSAICIGVGLYIFSQMWRNEQPSQPSGA